MILREKLTIPGVHTALITGPVGDLELILEVPPDVKQGYLAMIGHPHSLHGGTMSNKVVTTMVRSFRELGIASIRFNFRGVGRSSGEYDAGIGESEDMLHILSLCDCSGWTVFFAGFSFGSYVSFRALTQYQAAFVQQKTALISIAPSVHNYDYSLSLQPSTPWLIVTGDEDEIVPVELVREFALTHPSKPIVSYFSDTSHFFHGKLLDLKDVLQTHICAWLSHD